MGLNIMKAAFVPYTDDKYYRKNGTWLPLYQHVLVFF